MVWATLDKSKGRAAIKSFIVPREHPGVTVERLENKLGIKGSDTAVIRFDNARIPKDNLLGNPEIEPGKGFAGVMETFDNTRPVVAAMAVGIARATLEELRKILTNAGVEISYDKPSHAQSAAAAEFLRMEADWEAAYQLTLRAAWQADNKHPELQRSVDGQGQGRPGGQRHHPQGCRIGGHRRLFRGRRCWRSGPATRRSWTSSRAPSRFSSWWSPAACWGCRRPS